MPRSERTPDVSAELDIEAIIDKIHLERNVDLRNYKRATLRRRVERRMAERHCASPAEYIGLLDREPSEFSALISSMFIQVTSFFRDPETWKALAAGPLAEMLSSKTPTE